MSMSSVTLHPTQIYNWTISDASGGADNGASASAGAGVSDAAVTGAAFRILDQGLNRFETM